MIVRGLGVGSRCPKQPTSACSRPILSPHCHLAFAQSMAAWVSQLCRDVPALQAHAEAVVTLSTAQGFPWWVGLGTSLRGWAMADAPQAAVCSASAAISCFALDSGQHLEYRHLSSLVGAAAYGCHDSSQCPTAGVW
jgi:hypothetical protein